ncbi:MAG: hypothetical protein IID41_14490 [Planctomycetes bacterium]|nr:hypothetical protein [Planctomycetota bacterium]
MSVVIAQALVPMVILVAFAFGVAWMSDQCGKETVTIHCHCGARRTSLTLLEPADAQRFGSLLSEGCPNCRAAATPPLCPSVPSPVPEIDLVA